MSQRITFTPGGTSFWADLIEFAIVDTLSGQVLLQQANKDETEAVPYTGAPNPAQPIADLTGAGLVQLIGSPIAFINPKLVAEYETDGNSIVIVTFLSNRQQAFTFAAMANFLAWTPPSTTGVFEPGIGTLSVQQAGAAALALGYNSFAFGLNALASNYGAIAIGTGSSAGFGGLAIGVGAQGVSNYNISIGSYANTTSGFSAIAIGTFSQAKYDNTVSIGDFSKADDDFGIAIGKNATSYTYGIAIGAYALANTINSIAMGTFASVTGIGDAGIALIGSVTAVRGVAIGSNTQVNHTDSVAFQGRISNKPNYMFILGLDIEDGHNIHVGIGIGTKIGTSASQKLGFFGATPISQPLVDAAYAPGDTLTNTQTKLQNLVSSLVSLGIIDVL